MNREKIYVSLIFKENCAPGEDSKPRDLAMTNVTVQLSDREIAALKAPTGKRSAAAALKSVGSSCQRKAFHC
jgi:hypothetical protein